MNMMPMRRDGADELRTLQATAERLRQLAKLRLERRTAAAVAVCAAELERAVRMMELTELPRAG